MMTALRDDELLIEREFDAPLALVFRLWESRDHMMRWWGPANFTAVELDWTLAPGRPWHGAMTSKSKGLSRFSGVIREVVREKRIVFTFRWDHEPGRYPETLVTVTFAERNGKTIQIFHQTPFTDVAERDSHIGGWNSLFDKFGVYAENFAIAEREGLRA